MRQLVILSGKGGTGKTAVTSAFAHLAHLDPAISGAVFVDADVDAANLELLIGSDRIEEHHFDGLETAWIDKDTCISCGICQEVCRFHAIEFCASSGEFEVDPRGCEGCAACFYECPTESISLMPRFAGYWYRSKSRFGTLFHARLRPAQENSGKLVTLVKERAFQAASEEGRPLMVVDGPPGIACPAIAAVTGADLVLIVAEPTVAGIHDLERVGRMASHFRVDTCVCLNKSDLYPEGAERVERLCKEWGIRMLGRIPFDGTVTQALVDGRPVTEYEENAPASRALFGLWEEVKGALVEH